MASLHSNVFTGSHRLNPSVRLYCLPDMSDIGLGRRTTQHCLPHCIGTKLFVKILLVSIIWATPFGKTNIDFDFYIRKQIHLVLVSLFLLLLFWVEWITKCIGPSVAPGELRGWDLIGRLTGSQILFFSIFCINLWPQVVRANDQIIVFQDMGDFCFWGLESGIGQCCGYEDRYISFEEK